MNRQERRHAEFRARGKGGLEHSHSMPTIYTDPGCDDRRHRPAIAAVMRDRRFPAQYPTPETMPCGCVITHIK